MREHSSSLACCFGVDVSFTQNSLCSVFIIAFACNAKRSAIPYGKNKIRHKIRQSKKSSVKNFVIGKTIRHFLPSIFFAWLSENVS